MWGFRTYGIWVSLLGFEDKFTIKTLQLILLQEGKLSHFKSVSWFLPTIELLKIVSDLKSKQYFHSITIPFFTVMLL